MEGLDIIFGEDMNLLEALKTIEAHIRPGVTIECWMLSNGQMMRKVSFNDGDSFAATNAEWEAAIKAVAALSQMPTTVEDFGDKYPQAFVKRDSLRKDELMMSNVGIEPPRSGRLE
jgi:hypothetical protein